MILEMLLINKSILSILIVINAIKEINIIENNVVDYFKCCNRINKMF